MDRVPINTNTDNETNSEGDINQAAEQNQQCVSPLAILFISSQPHEWPHP